jgi:hypothetical protein
MSPVNFNYFRVLDSADKEMMHSAMLKLLLQFDDYFRRELFPAFPESIDPNTVVTEKVYPGKKRIDVEAHSANGRHILVIENKFKSFPTSAQLEKYDAIYATVAKGSKSAPETIVKYLVCFDESGVAFRNDKSLVRTNSGAEWHILTYDRIRDVLAAYLEGNTSLPTYQKEFFVHYVAWLDAYYKRFTAIWQNYSLAFAQELERKERSFWKCLILYALGNAFSERCRNECQERYEVFYNTGLTSEPILDIAPIHWNTLKTNIPAVSATSVAIQPIQWKDIKAPVLYIQIQAKMMKLYMAELKTVVKIKEEQTELLDYISRLQKNLLQNILPQNEKNLSSRQRLQRLLDRGKTSFRLYHEPLNVTGSFDNMLNQIWNFSSRMNAAVQKTGVFEKRINHE